MGEKRRISLICLISSYFLKFKRGSSSKCEVVFVAVVLFVLFCLFSWLVFVLIKAIFKLFK